MKGDPCLRCGKCCLLKVRFGNLYVTLEQHCGQYRLDNGLGTCLIFGKHTGTMIGNGVVCLSVEQMIEAGLAPQSCGYVKDIPNYFCRVINY